MSIEAATTTTTTATVSTNSTKSSSQTRKTSSESFKDEMEKVSDTKEAKESPKAEKKEESKDDKKAELKTDKKENKTEKQKIDNSDTQLIQISYEQNRLALQDVNSRLTDDILQMMNTTSDIKSWGISLEDGTVQNSFSMNEDDAQFFINLTKTDNVNIESINVQAQNMIDNGVQTQQVQQSVKVSQTLLNALSNARENGQPVRIDFDKDVSVILRVSKNGTIAAHFIPGDKAVEQYLRNNIDSLRNTFNENDLPYSDLSYSNSSKQQNERRRNQQRQGE
ncbi:hypothetical protein IJ579_06265 [bacterium]|nr:hypothetical protein [bacterium]